LSSKSKILPIFSSDDLGSTNLKS